jgi:hypothetical protein
VHGLMIGMYELHLFNAELTISECTTSFLKKKEKINNIRTAQHSMSCKKPRSVLLGIMGGLLNKLVIRDQQ